MNPPELGLHLLRSVHEQRDSVVREGARDHLRCLVVVIAVAREHFAGKSCERRESVEEKIRIALRFHGEKVSREFYDKALAERAQQTAQFRQVFKQVDALLTPTLPTVAPVLSANGDIYERGRQFTLPFSWVGVPSISVPCGFDGNGLSIGMQIIGDEMRESLLLRIAAAYEGATAFQRRRPPVHMTSAL